MGTLFVVATPIGNLEDISLRALRILREVQTIASEDTRTTRHLLQHYDIHTRLLSYSEHNRSARIPQILQALETRDIALVSEAGMPAISDPGQELVEAAAAAGHTVVPLPGSSALVAAVAISGLPSQQFLFLGFLPRQAGRRRALLRSVAEQPRALVCFEAPHRLRETLADMLECLGDRRLAACREMTKLHEETLRLRISTLVMRDDPPRGEYTLVIEGAEAQPANSMSAEAIEQLRELRKQGLNARDATKRIAAEQHLPRREVYRAWLALDDAVT